MKAETRLENAERTLHEAEDDIARQERIITELEGEGHSTRGAKTMLRLFDEALSNSRRTLEILLRPKC